MLVRLPLSLSPTATYEEQQRFRIVGDLDVKTPRMSKQCHVSRLVSLLPMAGEETLCSRCCEVDGLHALCSVRCCADYAIQEATDYTINICGPEIYKIQQEVYR